jgi:vancomycin resistance protein YoaR
MSLLSKEAESLPAPRPRRPSSRIRPPSVNLPWAVVLLPLIFLAIVLGAFRIARQGTLPNLKVSGIPVGGLDRGDLRAVVSFAATRWDQEKVTVVRKGGPGVAASTTIATRQALGHRMNVDATVDEILRRGRQGNPLAALADHMVASFVAIDVRPIEHVDARAFDQWVSDTVKELSIPAREGDLVFSGARVREIDPTSGATIRADELRDRARHELEGGGGRVTLTMTASSIAPRMTLQAVKDALADAQYALSGPVRLIRGKKSLEFTPEEIGQILEAKPVERNGQLLLKLAGDPDQMQKIAASQIDEVKVPAVDARFELTGDGVGIVPSQNGVGIDPKRAADALVRAAMSPTRRAKMKGSVIKPDLSTAEARSLRIDQVVSTFTTYFQCCPPRVTNIHRIADLLDGAVVKPGETLSVNAIVGERTPEKGFVIAPGISNGLIVDQLGGGISQFGTTIFNAVFFGGYRFVEFQHHSYYFTRYPEGRDATISYPGPDFAFKNDSKYGVYISTSYSDTSVTVTFYGHKNFTVNAETPGPYNFTDPPTMCKVNKSLKAGVVNVTQEGSQGFDILVKRVFEYSNGTTRSENFFTHYKPEPILIEAKSCTGAVAPSPPPSP